MVFNRSKTRSVLRKKIPMVLAVEFMSFTIIIFLITYRSVSAANTSSSVQVSAQETPKSISKQSPKVSYKEDNPISTIQRPQGNKNSTGLRTNTKSLRSGSKINESDFKQLFYMVLSALFATLFGIPGGLFIDRTIRKKQEKVTKAKIMKALDSEISLNLMSIKECLDSYQSGKSKLIDPPVYTGVWETLSHHISNIDNFPFVATVSEAYQHLQDLKFTTRLLWEFIVLEGQIQTSTDKKAKLDKISENIVERSSIAITKLDKSHRQIQELGL